MRDMHPLLELPQSDPEADGDRQFVMALARGLEVLRAFSGEGRPLSNGEMAKRSGLPKATVSRLAYTLTRLGYLEYLPGTERYQLGPAVMGLGYGYVVGNDLRRVARPYMQALCEYAGGTVAMSARDRLAMVYREVRFSPKLIGLRLDVGAQIPIASSAAGMAAIYAMSATEREGVLNALKARAPNWPAIEALIGKTHEQMAQRGFCVVRGGVFADSLAVAVPLAATDTRAAVVFNCAGPEYLMNEDQAHNDIGPRLRHMVSAIRADAATNRNG